MPHRPSVAIDPPLEPGEVEFIAAFAGEARGQGIRRVWPGQPAQRCAWRPSPDGRLLELDETTAQHEPDGVAGWLAFLSRAFLAPSTAASLEVALTEGLRAGHRLTGEVVLPDGRRVAIDATRITEELPQSPELDMSPEFQGVVLDLLAHRLDAIRGSDRPRRSARRSTSS